ncbi:MAG: FAD-dependent oxidoreductase [bacterium]
MDYVIVGNSVAAVAAIEAIRDQDQKGKITLFSEESYQNYSRPLISYFLAGKVSEKKIGFRSNKFYQGKKVDLHLNTKVKQVLPKEKKVLLEDGRVVPFDRLLICTGGRPIFPEIKGSISTNCDSSSSNTLYGNTSISKNNTCNEDKVKKLLYPHCKCYLKGVFNFTTLDQAKQIKEYIKVNKVTEAVIVGGGLIGIKAAEALLALKIKISIIELAGHLLSTTLDQKASHIIEKYLKKEEGQILTQNTISEITGKDKVEGVILKDGTSFPTQLVVMAIGVFPNVEIVKGSEIKINRGIIVDPTMQTSVSDIYAAGDVCESFDVADNLAKVLAIWPMAFAQGKVAGSNMAGVKKEYTGGLAMNSVEICGVPVVSVGITNPKQEEEFEILEDHRSQRSYYKKIIIKDDIIVGAIFVNCIDRAGIITGLIRNKIDVKSFKEYLLKENFGLISLPENYRKHLVTGVGTEI